MQLGQPPATAAYALRSSRFLLLELSLESQGLWP